jgi:hypothetical protein
MKNLLIVGNGSDILKGRGKFIDAFFNDVVFMNQTILHLDAYKEHIGTISNIWANCGWYSLNDVENETDDNFQLLPKFNEALQQSKTIKQIWLNCNVPQEQLSYKIPGHIRLVRTLFKQGDYDIPNLPHYASLGLSCILYAIKNYPGKVYYMGIDGYTQSYHFYDPKGHTPDNIQKMHQIHAYVNEQMILKTLLQQGRLQHIDSVYKS